MDSDEALRKAVDAQQSGNVAEAEKYYSEILAADAEHVLARYNRALIILQSGDLERARKEIDHVLTLAPAMPFALAMKARMLGGDGQISQAVELLRTALNNDPANAAIRILLGEALYKIGEFSEGAHEIEQVLAQDPRNSRAIVLLAEIKAHNKAFDESESLLRRAVAAGGKDYTVLNNLAIAVRSQGRLAEAIELYRQAIPLAPDNPEAYNNLGSALYVSGRDAEAESAYREALRVAPAYGQTHKNLGIMLLAQGRFRDGWREYAWRIERGDPEQRRRIEIAPLWDGKPIDGGRLLVWREQGVGDELLYASMLPDLVAAKLDFVFECDGRLVPLFHRSFPDLDFVPFDIEPDARITADNLAAQCPLSHLGQFFRNDFGDFPARNGYLTADPEQSAALRKRYVRNGGPVIGVSWRSKAEIGAGLKSSALSQWGALLKRPDTIFVNLQYGDCTAEIAEAGQLFGVEIICDPEIDSLSDLDSFAAQVSAMDMVISTSNTTVHMAGALGVPVWTLLPKGGLTLWYWFRGHDVSPWYPSMRLFHQKIQGDWGELLQRIRNELDSTLLEEREGSYRSS